MTPFFYHSNYKAKYQWMFLIVNCRPISGDYFASIADVLFEQIFTGQGAIRYIRFIRIVSFSNRSAGNTFAFRLVKNPVSLNNNL